MNQVLNRFYDQFTDVRDTADGQLLARFLTARDESAFAELIRRYGPVVWGVCRRQLASHQDAEDAFQATFLVLVRRANELTGARPIGPWLYRVAVLTARRVIRGNNRRAAIMGPMEHEVLIPNSEPAVEKLDLDGALMSLPERDRVAVVLCHLQGFTRREAAERIGCPEGTLSARLNRALQRLRELLGDGVPLVLAGAAVAVPTSLASASVRSATIYSTSTLTAAGVSPEVVELTDGVLRMFWLKKVMTAVMIAVLVLGTGVLGLGTVSQSPSTACGTEQGAGNATDANSEEPVTLKRLEKRVSDLEKQRAQFDAAFDDLKAQKSKPGTAPPKEEELKEPTPKELLTSVNNLKQIGLAFHNYADDHNSKWADDITDKDGQPLLSWRVALLPYLGAKDLYKEFKLDEPWDSDHNKKLIAKMPAVYAPVRVKAKKGETFYQRFVGKGALFNEKGSSYTIPQVPDGTSNTALVVEAGDSVIWTKPADLPFNMKGPLPKLGGLFDGDFHILFCDGSVHTFKKDYDLDEMRNVIIPDDGNVVDFKKLQKTENTPPTAKELRTSVNNLKHIGLAFHNYASANGDKWADDLTDKDGQPLLSWRVALLPYLGAKDLYKEFKLDEPWDSDHNKKLIAKMPAVYAPVRVKAKKGETFYQRFVGKGALFNEKGSSYTIGKVPDGTSNTALVVEAGDPVIWTKPADLPFNMKGPLPKLGGLFDGDFHVVFCDGAVITFKKKYDLDEMRNVIIPDDGNVVDFKKLRK